MDTDALIVKTAELLAKARSNKDYYIAIMKILVERAKTPSPPALPLTDSRSLQSQIAPLEWQQRQGGRAANPHPGLPERDPAEEDVSL